jgi:hypothetical protein
MSGHRSMFPSRILAERKSRSIEVEVGKELRDMRIDIKSGKKRSQS